MTQLFMYIFDKATYCLAADGTKTPKLNFTSKELLKMLLALSLDVKCAFCLGYYGYVSLKQLIGARPRHRNHFSTRSRLYFMMK